MVNIQSNSKIFNKEFEKLSSKNSGDVVSFVSSIVSAIDNGYYNYINFSNEYINKETSSYKAILNEVKIRECLMDIDNNKIKFLFSLDSGKEEPTRLEIPFIDFKCFEEDTFSNRMDMKKFYIRYKIDNETIKVFSFIFIKE